MKFKKGQIPWNKNKKGIHLSRKTEFSKNSIPWNKGKNLPEKVKKKISQNRKGKGCREKQHLWKGGISKMNGYHTLYARRYKLRKKQTSGGHTFGEWETLKAQYDWTCPACGIKEPEIKLTEDHIVPISKNGSDNIENIQPLCARCNSKKHTQTINYKGR